MAEQGKVEEKLDLRTAAKKVSAGASYRNMQAAKEQGKPICSAAAGVPIEIMYALDVHPIYPESLAAIAAGIGKANEFFDLARDHGYSQSICSYTRCGIGIEWLNKCAFGPIPEPDIYISDVSLCCLHVSWWKHLGEHFQKPTFYVDMPFTDDPRDPEYVAYYEQQLRDMVKFVEENTDRKLSMDKLKQAVAHSDLGGLYWKKILELRKNKPSPVSFRNLAGEIIALVTALGTKEAAEFYELLHESYAQDVAKGRTPAKGGERYRLIWNGIPIWHHLGVINYFEEKGANFVWEPYTALSWGNKTPSGRLDPEKPFETLAEKYTHNISFLPLQKRYEYFDRAIKDYDVDGLVMFSNRSCRPMSIGQDEVVEMVREGYDIPILIFEGDQADAEGFNMQEAKNKIDGFIEVLEARK